MASYHDFASGQNPRDLYRMQPVFTFRLHPKDGFKPPTLQESKRLLINRDAILRLASPLLCLFEDERQVGGDDESPVSAYGAEVGEMFDLEFCPGYR